MKLREMLGIRRSNKRELSQLMRQKQVASTLYYQHLALNETRPGVGNNLQQELVVSLTTFNKRIHDVYLTIESLFQQSLQADRVILWLSREEFDPLDIPQTLRNLEPRGLTIAFCDEDLGPYKKFYYALQQYPDSLLVTVDDDILYPPDTLDMLYRAWQREPRIVHCHRAHKIGFDDKGRLAPYMSWDKNTSDTRTSLLIMPTGVGGVLYFPGCFHPEVLNKPLFMAMAPRADDIWLKAMTLKQGIPSRKLEDPRPWKARFLMLENSQLFALKHENMKRPDGNDLKLQHTFNHFELLPELAQTWRNQQ